MTPVVRAVAYYRMSTADQEASIPRQKEWAAQACQREGINLVRPFEDAGISGGTVDHRPGLLALLQDAEQAAIRGKPYDALVCWNLDRLSRADSMRTAGILCGLQDAGISRIFTTEGWIDLNNGTDRVLFNLKQDFGRNAFLRDLSLNVAAGMVNQANKGFFLGSRPPFGYDARSTTGEGGSKKSDNNGDKRKKRLRSNRLVPNAHADVVRKIFADYLAGASLAEIALGLNHTTIKAPRGGDWKPLAIRRILTNKAYRGDIVWNATHYGTHSRIGKAGARTDEQASVRRAQQRRNGHRNPARQENAPEDWVVVEDAHPALVSREDWARCQDVRRRRKSSGRGKNGMTWALSGVLHCGECGKVMYAATRKQKGRAGKVYVYRYFQCSSARLGVAANICTTSGMVDHDAVLQQVVALLKDQLGRPEALASIRDNLRTELDRRRGDLGRELVQLQARAKELDGKISKGTENLALMPADLVGAVAELVQAWKTERADIAAQMARAQAEDTMEHEGKAEEIEDALALVGRLDELIADAEPADIRAALAPLVQRVTLHFREATEQDRKGRRGNVRHTLDRMKVELSPSLLKLFCPATPKCG